MLPEIPQIYANRARLRACGLCWKEDRLLLVNHRLGPAGSLWLPPGGGIEFGETTSDTLVREFREETGITVLSGRFQFTCEFIQPPLHAIELFFEVDYLKGEATKGSDPEVGPFHQIITDVRYMHMDEILRLPETERHGIFRTVKTASDLKKSGGFYRI